MIERLGTFIRKEVKKKIDTLPASASEFTKVVEDCIEYFEHPNQRHNKRKFPIKLRTEHRTFKIHSMIEVGRTGGEHPKIYFSRDVLHAPGQPPYKETITVENNNLVREKTKYPNGESLGKDSVTRADLRNIVQRIHQITFPYEDYLRTRNNRD